MDLIKKAIVRTKLKSMFKDNHYSIRTVDNCLKIMGVIADKEIYDMLHGLHCVNFGEMEKELREWCFTSTYALFNNEGFDFDKVEGVLKELDPEVLLIEPHENDPKKVMKKFRGLLTKWGES